MTIMNRKNRSKELHLNGVWPILLGALAVICFVSSAIAVYLSLADSTKAQVDVVRWGKVTVEISQGSGVTAVGDFAPAQIKPPSGGQVLLLSRGESSLAIDAESGKVLEDAVLPADRTSFDGVLGTLQLSAQADSGAWPIGGIAPPVERRRWGNLTYLPPDPSSGFEVFLEIGDSAEGGSRALQLTNGRSTLAVDAETGE